MTAVHPSTAGSSAALPALPAGPPLTIGFDIRRSGGFGIGVYIKNLLAALARVGAEHQYLLIGAEEHQGRFDHLGSNFRFVPYERSYKSQFSHLEYGLEMRRLGADVLHVPHRWAPFSIPRPYIITLHDLNHLNYPPEGVTRWREQFNRTMLVRTLKRASTVIAVSEATKRDALKRLPLTSANFRVIPDAVDEQLALPVSDAERKETLERYSINDPFVLYAGRIQTHKNVPRLIEAFAVVKSQLENHWKFHNLKLIVIGDDMNADPNVRHTVLRTRTQNSVRFLGFVPMETLRVFYDQATAFLFPSLYEGFGMPPLEAMSHGTPVVTSNVSSLPEAVGDAAVLVNPENVFDIGRGLRKVLLDDEYRDGLIRAGHEQVNKFSWDQTAVEVLDCYQKAVRKQR